METGRRIQRPICLKYLDDLMRFDWNNVNVSLVDTVLI